VKEEKGSSSRASEGNKPMKTPISRDEIDAEKRALRVLLDSFHTEQETLLEETLDDPYTRRKIGTFIGHTMVKPYWGEH
jgi:hypothetical protein